MNTYPPQNSRAKVDLSFQFSSLTMQPCDQRQVALRVPSETMKRWQTFAYISSGLVSLSCWRTKTRWEIFTFNYLHGYLVDDSMKNRYNSMPYCVACAVHRKSLDCPWCIFWNDFGQTFAET